MFVVDLIRNALTSPTQCNDARKDHKIFGNWKNATVQKWWLGSLAAFCWQSDHTNNYSFYSLTISYCSFHFFQMSKTLQAHQKSFMDIAGFPGVDVSDWTHIRNIALSQNEDIFVTERHTTALMLICFFSADYKVLDNIAKWLRLNTWLRGYCLRVAWDSFLKDIKCQPVATCQGTRAIHANHGSLHPISNRTRDHS